MSPMAPYDDWQSFVEACKMVSDWREISGVNWHKELGTLTEAVAESSSDPPMLIFDHILGYPEGFRVVSLALASHRRFAVALGMDPELNRIEIVRQTAHRLNGLLPIAPRVVSSGLVMECRLEGDAVDITRFPAPHFHAGDGGRYIGTGDTVICRDPETGYVNVGTHRMQIHDRDLLGLWMSPGQQDRLICERYWANGQSCPLVATFGGDPLLFMASHNKLPWGQSELDWAGGLRGKPIEVIEGPLTGLPIPAHAEIAIEGEALPPDELSRAEGPFGEWPGYYSGGTIGTGRPQPVVRIRAIYHRQRPWLHDQTPLWPGAPTFGIRFDSALLWNQLENAGVQDVRGVFCSHPFWIVVSIRQRAAGHARQAGMAVLGCSAGARNGRFVVIVDDDIDPSNMQEVLWAIQTRCDPVSDIQCIEDTWSTPLDPRMSPAKREQRDFTNSRAIVYAVRPYPWKDRYPQVSRASREERQAVMHKYRDLFAFFQ